MRKKHLAILVAAMMLLVPVAVFAGDSAAEQSVAAGKADQSQEKAADAVDEGSAEPTEEGATTTNNGTISVNNGTITTNNGTILVNNGTILNNNGTVETNNGTITNNNGTIVNNHGTITTNNGTIENQSAMTEEEGLADAEQTTYAVIEGNQQTWEGSGSIRFLTDGAYKNLKGIEYGRKGAEAAEKLDEANFSAHKEDKTTVITLKESFLKTLEPGDYVASAVYEDGKATAEFSIVKLDETPATGSGDVLPWILLSSVIVSGAGIVILSRKRIG